jgi:UDP-N-acetyl-D-galactosamine dehydrogenase
VIDVIQELQSFGVEVHVHDPVADSAEAHHEYGVELTPWDALPRADAVVAAVAHKELIGRPFDDYRGKVVAGGCFIDVKSQFDPAQVRAAGLNLWRL